MFRKEVHILDMDHLSSNENPFLSSERQARIFSKGFDMLSSNKYIDYRTADNNFSKIKVGVKNLEDAVLELGELKKTIP